MHSEHNSGTNRGAFSGDSDTDRKDFLSYPEINHTFLGHPDPSRL